MSRVEGADFEEFYRLEFGRVARAIAAQAGSRAEDFAQEAFLVAHAKWDDVGALDLPVAWVRKVALRIAWRHREREAARARVEGLGSQGGESLDGDLDLVAALVGLPDRHAAAIRLHHLQDLPIVDVAEQLGCSVSAAKVLLMRGRQQLGRRLSGVDGRWVSERHWTPDAIARHVTAFAGAASVGPILEEDLRGIGGRWELFIHGRDYWLERSDGLHLDRGRFDLARGRATIEPTDNTGTASFRLLLDGDRAKVADICTSLPPTRGVADIVWLDLFLESGPLRYAGPACTM
jgi:RNA polymerase sigma-70 factor (ECF subfamily)